jgi:transglutaminase/protease-like cytokinesis protein 3
LTTSESLEKRVALCDEFSNILTEFCQSLNIPSLRIEGYVKYLDFKAGAKFEECNHAWNAVYIGSTWYLCDLFWSTSVLKIKAFASSRFEKAMNTKYFLASPDDFLDTHLPCSPVFQFNAHPISISTFSSLGIGVDTIMSRMRFYNYNDSLKTLVAMRPADRVVKIAQQAYAYNPANPNLLIIEYYNYAIEVLNNKKATKLELKKAKAYLGSALKLFDQSKKEEVMALKEICKKGIFAADRRLARS